MSVNRIPNHKCLVCGTEVYRRPREIKRNKGKVFCSLKCFGVSSRKPTPCIYCGKEYLAATKNTKYCSITCSNKSRTGISYEKNKDHFGKNRSKEVIYWRDKLKGLRGEKCEKCGDTSVSPILVLHHIIHRKDKGTNCEENLMLLCPNCHAWEHTNRV